MAKRIPLETRFWAKVEKTETCWLWTAWTAGNGYGYIGRGGHAGPAVGAHRLSYELAYGPIPEGLVVDHTCHVPLCVNPKHLRLVTHKQNHENRPDRLRPNNSSGIPNVSWNAARRKWSVYVRHDYKTRFFGNFDDLQEAGEAARRARLSLFTHNDVDRVRVEPA